MQRTSLIPCQMDFLFGALIIANKHPVGQFDTNAKCNSGWGGTVPGSAGHPAPAHRPMSPDQVQVFLATRAPFGRVYARHRPKGGCFGEKEKACIQGSSYHPAMSTCFTGLVYSKEQSGKGCNKQIGPLQACCFSPGSYPRRPTSAYYLGQ